jgi:hypothetical protein
MESKHAAGMTAEEILAPVRATLRYDIQGWIEAGMPADTRPYRFSAPQELVFELPPDAHRELKAGLEVWSATLKGLTKGITRIKASAQNRLCRPAGDATYAGNDARATV